MTGDQVVQILDETVNWYRTLGAQQEAAPQPSDLLILYANRQTADKVVALAFEIARANAELLASDAGLKQEAEDAASAQSLGRLRKKLDEQRASIQAEVESTRRQLASAPREEQATLQSRIAVLQGQLDLVNARRNMLGNMAQFASETDTTGFGANALKAHIDAIAASIPAASGTSTPAPTAAASAAAASGSDSAASGSSLSRFGIWDLAATVFRLSSKARTIDQIDQRTAELQETFKQIRTPPLEQLKRLSDRGDALAAEAESANSANLRGMRDQYDTLAWLFQQTSSIVTPLSKILQRRGGVVLVVRAQGVQHIVEQRHRVGARRRIGDLHREQRRAGPCAADGGGGQRAAAGGPAVGDALLADRAGLAV